MDAANILVPVDFSAPSAYGLSLADQWAAQRNGQLFLLHVHPVVEVAVMDFSWMQPAEHLGELREALNQQLGEWAAKLKTPADRVRYEVVLGTPIEEIIARSKDFDVAVLGTHGRSGLTHFLLGSVAERVVQGAQCSVFIAKQRE